MTVSLTGFMGCGKSSVGKRLSTLLSCEFTDLDEYIAGKVGKSIPQIFSDEGETGFRKIEAEALDEVLRQRESYPDCISVLSLGGGTLTLDECRMKIKSSTLCFYLKAGLDTLAMNLENDSNGRPMLQSDNMCGLKGRITSLMKERADKYEDAAEYIIETDGKTFDEIAWEIVKLVKISYGNERTRYSLGSS